jgi:hypothetical protein
MAHSFISRLLQISPAAAGIVFLASFVGGGQGGRSGHGGHGGADADLAVIPELALVTDIPSHEGRYVASLTPAEGSAWDGSEGWTISLRDANGDRVEGAALAVEAWQPDEMAAASKSATAESFGTGQYRVDDIALGSGGWWNVKLAIAGAPADSLAFNVVLR